MKDAKLAKGVFGLILFCSAIGVIASASSDFYLTFLLSFICLLAGVGMSIGNDYE